MVITVWGLKYDKVNSAKGLSVTPQWVAWTTEFANQASHPSFLTQALDTTAKKKCKFSCKVCFVL